MPGSALKWGRTGHGYKAGSGPLTAGDHREYGPVRRLAAFGGYPA